MLLTILLAAFTFTSAECGVSFVLPRRWTAEATRECDVALRPRGWSRMARRSRWTVSDVPLRMIVYKRGMTFKQALEAADFQHDGAHYWKEGGYGSKDDAKPYAVGRYRGVIARTFTRIFLRDGAPRGDEEPRAAGQTMVSVLMKAPRGRVVGFECASGTPDEPIDCDATIRAVLRTLKN